MILFFLTSGLFLGWSLGANDASHIFGSAVGSKMVTFRKAAIIASVFFILGAVIQGSGTSHTLGKLGAVNAIGGSFTLALAAAITIYMMTKFALPISTTQAIVGAIIGWNFFTGNHTDSKTLVKDSIGMDCRSGHWCSLCNSFIYNCEKIQKISKNSSYKI